MIGYDPVAWNRGKCIYSVLYSDLGGLEHADLNVTVLWAAIQILQSFITWINLLAPELFFLILAHPVYKM